MIDLHAHLASPRFDVDRSDVRRRAHDKGVRTVLVVGEDFEDNERVLRICKSDPDVGASLVPLLGLHPDRFAEDRPAPDRATLDAIYQQIRDHRGELAGIGEVGLDRHWVKTAERRTLQAQALEEIAALSIELKLPLNVHSRAAGHYTIDLLVNAGAKNVLMHAFDGKVADAARAAEDHGFVFSIPPSVLRSPDKQRMIKGLPLAALALESDSPVLGPERSERNEPANLHLTQTLMAEAHGVSIERVQEVTTLTAQRIFPSLR